MFRETVTKNLLAIVGAYQKATGKSLSTISKEFYGRGDFLEKLKDRDHTISIDRLSVMLDEFRRNWPKNAIWPSTRAVLMTQNPRR